jgi:hypothetical protein
VQRAQRSKLPRVIEKGDLQTRILKENWPRDSYLTGKKHQGDQYVDPQRHFVNPTGF